MTLLNSNTDVEPLVNQPFNRATSHAEATRQLTARRDALLVTIGNFADMADRAVDRWKEAHSEGDTETARLESESADELLDAAQPYTAELNEIESLRINK